MVCPTGADVEHAAQIIQKGGLVAFATETVYGLGANALDPVAVARIFEAKNRPHFDPLICHISSAEGISKLAEEIPDSAVTLAEKFWPGPLTMILPKKEIVPDLVTSGLSTVGIRVPAHQLARKLIESAGVPIAAPSANLFGKVSPTTAEHVADQLGDRIDYILEGGASEVGVESTVIDCTSSPLKILRPGGVTLEDLQAVFKSIEIATESSSEQETGQLSPGQLPEHYAPWTKLMIQNHAERPKDLSRVGLICFSEPENACEFEAVEVLSSNKDLKEAASRFFSSLRKLDQLELDCIIAIPFPEEGLGRALNDRLKRAAQKI